MRQYKTKPTTGTQKQKPVILQGQPDTFAILQDPEDLRNWEEDLKELTGLGHLPMGPNVETCTESGNPTNECDTD